MSEPIPEWAMQKGEEIHRNTGNPDRIRDNVEAIARALAETAERVEAERRNVWRSMDSAPTNGKHCILAVPASGGFIYSVQGAFQGGQWNAVHDADVKPLAWMPNVLLPPEFLPAKYGAKT